MNRILSIVLTLGVLGGVAATSAAWTPDPTAPGSTAPDEASTTTATTDAAGSDEPLVTRARAGATATSTAACRKTVSTRHPIVRLSGADRYATATCTSQVGYPDGADTVVLARGDDTGGYADALAGTVLAHHVTGPVLLTEPRILPASTAAELRRLSPTTVLLLGGTGAISDDVKARVEALGITTERIEGHDRAATAAAIAGRLGATDRAFVVNGFRPADALVAGTVAAREGAALLLSYPGEVPDVTARALAGKAHVAVVGGYGVVDAKVEARLRSIVPQIERLSGYTRAETAASVARARETTGGTVHLVAGTNRSLVDAISAGWLAALPGGGPVLYSDATTPGSGSDRYLRLGGLKGRAAVALVGGEAVLGKALVTTLEARLDEAAAGGPKPQVRGAWVHLFDDSLKSPQGIDRFLDRATLANMNTVVVQVSRRQDAYYRSDVLPRTPDPRMPGDLDLLGRLVPAAHARGLEVHAWYAVAQGWHPAYEGIQGPDNWVWNEHGPLAGEQNWFTQPSPNNPEIRSKLGYTGGTAGYRSYPYLDLGAPPVQDHIVATLTEVVRNYDIDAVHLDYIRYPGIWWGYNHLALREFQRQTGRDGSYIPPESDTEWTAWRRGRVTELVRRIDTEIGKIDPDVLLSAAVIAQGDGPVGGNFAGTIAYRDKLQDWAAWARDGTVDMTFPMAYFREGEPRWATAYDRWVAFTRTVAGIRAVGQGSWLNTSTQSLSQVGQALDNTHGAILYSYQQDSASEPHFAMWDRLRAGRWAEPAPAPRP